MSKKKSTPLPFKVQVLTTEYIIEGTVEGDTCLEFRTDETDETIVLSSVRVQSLRPSEHPPRYAEHFALWGGSAVALIPEADVSKGIADKHWNLYDAPRRELFYMGPYLIQGRLMLLSREYVEETLPMFDVTITCKLHGMEWVGVNAPFALVNTHWLHGHELA
jgi:hypothetical protein